MRWLVEARERLLALVFRSREERELDEEMRFHLEMETERLVAQGIEPREARRRAVLAFGGIERFKEETRDAFGTRWIEDAARDIVFAARSLARRPGFALAVIGTLALGIGGTTAVYSLVEAVLVHPLPYEEPERLVRLYQWDEEEPDADLFVSAPHFLDYRGLASSFEALASVYTYAETGADLMLEGTAERVRALRVSSGYFNVLKQRPLLGRSFTVEDEAGTAVAILSEHLWRRLGAESSVLGEHLTIDGVARTIVGVMPKDTEDPLVGGVDVWLPEDLRSEGAAGHPGNHYLSVVGRLAAGVTPAQAREEMQALDRTLAEKYPDVADDGRFRLVPLAEDLVREVRPVLLLLLGAVGLVLLIACINVANLLIARSLGRRREMAMRSALGARSGRIARQLLVESLLLAGTGGAAGLFVAWAGIQGLVAGGREALPSTADVALDGTVLAATAAVAILAGLAFGLAPALRLSRTPAALALRTASRSATDDRTLDWTRKGLVVAQVALALVLLFGTGVLGASVYRLMRLDLGIRTDRVVSFELNLPEARYEPPRRAVFHREMANRLAGLSGATAVGATSWLPARGSGYVWGTLALTGPRAGEEERVGTEQRIVAGDFFSVLDVPLLQGRVFDTRDTAETKPVAVISQEAASRLFPDVSPLGHRIRMGGVERDVVGVVGDVAVDGAGRTAPTVYHAQVQYADRDWAMSYLVAADVGIDPESLIPGIRRQVAAVDPALVVHDPILLEEVVARGYRRRQLALLCGAAFAGVALGLAVLGLYGVVAYLARRRQREISIRVALGAGLLPAIGLVLRQGVVLVGAGIVVGGVGALLLRRALTVVTFHTDPADPRIFGIAAFTLLIGGAAASLLPAYRIARTPLRETLTSE